VSEPLVIIGNGMAAARLVDELAKCALGRYAVAVIGDEPRLAYNRVLLSSVLAGETTSEDIELKPAAWWRDRGVTLKYGCLATEIDIGRREIKIANDESVSFSRLVLAMSIDCSVSPRKSGGWSWSVADCSDWRRPMASPRPARR